MLRQDPYMARFAAKQASAKESAMQRRQLAGFTALENYIKMWQSSNVPLQEFVQNSQEAFTGILSSAGLPTDVGFSLMAAARDKPVSAQDLLLSAKNAIAENEFQSGGIAGGVGGQAYDPLAVVQGIENPTTEALNRYIEGISTDQLEPALADGKHPVSELGKYGAKTGDVHRPALIGDQEAVINKEGVRALEKIFGPDFFTRLQKLFPNKDADSIPDSEPVTPYIAADPSQHSGYQYASPQPPPAPVRKDVADMTPLELDKFRFQLENALKNTQDPQIQTLIRAKLEEITPTQVRDPRIPEGVVIPEGVEIPSFEDGKAPARAEAYAQYRRLRQADKNYEEQRGQENREWVKVPLTILREEPGVWEVGPTTAVLREKGERFVYARRKAQEAPYRPAEQAPGRPYVPTYYDEPLRQSRVQADPDFTLGVSTLDQDPKNITKNFGIIPDGRGSSEEVLGIPEPPVPVEPPPNKDEPEELFKRQPEVTEGFWAGILPGIEKAYADLAKSSPGVAQLMGLDNFVQMYNTEVFKMSPDVMKNQLDYLKFLHDKEIDFAKLTIGEFKALDTQAYRRAQAANAAAAILVDEMRLNADITDDQADNLYNRVKLYSAPLLELQASAIAGEPLNLHGLEAINAQLGDDVTVEAWYVPNGERGGFLGRFAQDKDGLSHKDFMDLSPRQRQAYSGMILLNGRSLAAPGLGGTPEFSNNLFDRAEYEE